MPDVSKFHKKMVDQRLKELELEGMVERKVISDRPIAVSYELTELGRTALNNAARNDGNASLAFSLTDVDILTP